MIRLQDERERRRLSRCELARLAGVDNGRLGQMEAGRMRPPRHGVELLRLAVALGLPVAAAGSLLDPAETTGARHVPGSEA